MQNLQFRNTFFVSLVIVPHNISMFLHILFMECANSTVVFIRKLLLLHLKKQSFYGMYLFEGCIY